MRVLILGATGFTGSVLVSYLSKSAEVSLLTAMIHKTNAPQQQGVEYVKSSIADISTEFLVKGDYDLIFHLARIPGKRLGNAGRLAAGWQGAYANKKLIKKISTLTKRPRLVYLSGSLMYGHKPNHEFKETDELNPCGFAKYYYLAERPILNVINSGATHIIMLRAPWIIGNGSWFNQLYARHIEQQHSVPVYGNVARRMSLVTVEDCAGLLWNYATRMKEGGCYNIFTETMTYEKFISAVGVAYENTKRKYYSDEDLAGVADKTTQQSICCEAALGTHHHDFLNSYKPIHGSIADYLLQLAKK